MNRIVWLSNPVNPDNPAILSSKNPGTGVVRPFLSFRQDYRISRIYRIILNLDNPVSSQRQEVRKA